MAGMGEVVNPRSVTGGGYLDVSGQWHYSYDGALTANEQIANEQKASNLSLESAGLANRNAALANESASIDIAAKKAALKNQAAASQMTNEFLAKWGDMNQKALEVLTSSLSGSLTGGNAGGGGVYADLINDIKGQISSFDTNYGDMTKRAFDSSMSDIEARRGITTDLTNMAQTDYEGVSGRAAADVGAQSEIARGDMAREAMSYGIDPSAGKFGALQKKSYLGEARNKVEAMNKARASEKERSAGLKVTAAQLIDPSASAGIATNLMNQKGKLYDTQISAANAMSTAEKAKSDTALGVANTIKDIGEQYGSLGSTMLGIQTAQGGSAGGGGGVNTTTMGSGGSGSRVIKRSN